MHTGTMWALVKDQPAKGLSMKRVEIPAVGDNDVMIKIHKTAICGTDVHIWDWNEWAQNTFRVGTTAGHEYVGEIVEMGAFALSGEVVERQFYIKIWDRVSDGVERDLLQKLKLLGGYFSDSGIQTEILQQQDIVRLCNLVNNPAYVHLEDSGINAAIPILESVGVA